MQDEAMEDVVQSNGTVQILVPAETLMSLQTADAELRLALDALYALPGGGPATDTVGVENSQGSALLHTVDSLRQNVFSASKALSAFAKREKATDVERLFLLRDRTISTAALANAWERGDYHLFQATWKHRLIACCANYPLALKQALERPTAWDVPQEDDDDPDNFLFQHHWSVWQLGEEISAVLSAVEKANGDRDAATAACVNADRALGRALAAMREADTRGQPGVLAIVQKELDAARITKRDAEEARLLFSWPTNRAVVTSLVMSLGAHAHAICPPDQNNNAEQHLLGPVLAAWKLMKPFQDSRTPRALRAAIRKALSLECAPRGQASAARLEAAYVPEYAQMLVDAATVGIEDARELDLLQIAIEHSGAIGDSLRRDMVSSGHLALKMTTCVSNLLNNDREAALDLLASPPQVMLDAVNFFDFDSFEYNNLFHFGNVFYSHGYVTSSLIYYTQLHDRDPQKFSRYLRETLQFDPLQHSLRLWLEDLKERAPDQRRTREMTRVLFNDITAKYFRPKRPNRPAYGEQILILAQHEIIRNSLLPPAADALAELLIFARKNLGDARELLDEFETRGITTHHAARWTGLVTPEVLGRLKL